MKHHLLILCFLALGLGLITLWAATVSFSEYYEEYGTPAFLRLDLVNTPQGRYLTSVEFKPLGFILYLIAAAGIGFLTARYWFHPHNNH